MSFSFYSARFNVVIFYNEGWIFGSIRGKTVMYIEVRFSLFVARSLLRSVVAFFIAPFGEVYFLFDLAIKGNEYQI